MTQQLGNNWLPLQSLRIERFRILWISVLCWNIARWMDTIILGWLALEITNSAWHVALVGFFRFTPMLLLGAYAGAISDIADRRKLLAGAAAINVLAASMLVVLIFVDRLEYWHITAASFMLGSAWTFCQATRRSLIPELVGYDLVMPALAIDSLSINVSKIAGPLTAGALLASLGIQGSYPVVAMLYVISLLLLLFLRLSVRPVRSEPLPVFQSIREGLRICLNTPLVRGVLLISIAVNLFGFPFGQFLPVFARDVLAVGPFGLGVLATGDGIGAAIGSSILMSTNRVRRHGWLFVLSAAGMCMALAVFATTRVFPLSLLLLLALGVGISGFTTLQASIMLNAVEARFHGRVMGIQAMTIGSAPLGMLFMGAIAATVSTPWALGLSGILGTALIVAVAVSTPTLLAFQPLRSAATGKESPTDRRGPREVGTPTRHTS